MNKETKLYRVTCTKETYERYVLDVPAEDHLDAQLVAYRMLQDGEFSPTRTPEVSVAIHAVKKL